MSPREGRLSVLFRGWIAIPHSYAMVNCFQLLHLYKNHKDKIDIYIEETEYFRKEWNNSRKLVYGEENNAILQSLKKWNGERVDLVYSITYPYNISDVKIGGKSIPKCVFYTSEFSWIDRNYFCLDNYRFAEDVDITQHLAKNNDIFFTSPSVWSSKGITRFGIPDQKNRIITHGVDQTIFKLLPKATSKNGGIREQIRKFYKVKDTDILLINIGAMTQNKGIMLILYTLNVLVNKLNKPEFKLLLKGTQDLYTSKEFLETYFTQLQADNHMTKEDTANLLTNHIIFSDRTLGYDRINDFFNAADLYISPYLAEGFNLTVLEALSAGLPVLVPETGSTKEYINDIYANGGGKDFIFQVKSDVVSNGDMKQNSISLNDLINLVVNNIPNLHRMKTERYMLYKPLSDYMATHYSWDRVSDLLMDYFNQITNRLN